jgi:hypothetical protein
MHLQCVTNNYIKPVLQWVSAVDVCGALIFGSFGAGEVMPCGCGSGPDTYVQHVIVQTLKVGFVALFVIA